MMKVITRRVNRVVRVLLILLIVAFSSVGCMREKAKFETGNFRVASFFRVSMMMALQSDQDVFPIDDVTVDLFYGLYDVDIVEDEHNGNPRGEYSSQPGHIVFVLYAYDFSNIPDLYEVSDYTKTEGLYFIKDIPEEEAFSEDYGYEADWLAYITYHHNEQITIPQESFTSDKGDILLTLSLWDEYEKGSGKHFYCWDTSIRLGYERLDDNRVKLYF